MLEYIEKAKQKLKREFNSKEEFWLVVVNAKNIHTIRTVEDCIRSLKLDKSYIEKIDYEDLNSRSNIPTIIEIFKNIGIDIDDYNKQIADRLDLQNYYKESFEKLQIELKEKYFFIAIQNIKTQKLYTLYK